MPPAAIHVAFTGEAIHWRGPAPYVYVRLPDDVADAVAVVAGEVSYGWGCIPVDATIGHTTWYTAMFPRDGGYMLPLKVAVRRAEEIDLGDHVRVDLAVRAP